MSSTLTRYGEWALVTGASMGLGEAFARRLAAEGLNLVLVALEDDLLAKVADGLRAEYGVECRTLALDLSRDDMLDVVTGATEGIEIAVLVNNAGFGVGGPFASRDFKRLEAMVKVNCLAPLALTRHFLPGMISRRRGAIVMVGSVMSFISAPYEAAYNASKAFDLHFGESLWGELRGTGVDVITLCPGGMKTGFFTAEGIRPGDVNRLHKFSNTPDQMAGLALRKLGRKPTVSPGFTWAMSMLVRTLPRSWVALIVRTIMRHFVRYDAPLQSHADAARAISSEAPAADRQK